MGNMQAPRVQNSKTGFMVHMRGLPFEATQGDVFKFFAPLTPVDIRILYEESGRPKGECDVDFNTHVDAESAMQKDKQNMGHRYVELFLRSNGGGGDSNGWGNNNGNSTPLMGNGYGGGGGGYGGGFGGNSGGYDSFGYGSGYG